MSRHERIQYQFTTVADPEFKIIKDAVASLKAKRDLLLDEKLKAEQGIATSEKRTDTLQKARALVQRVARETQQQLEVRIGGVVGMALAAVFDDPYEFVARFVERRNRTECDLLFRKSGEEFDPVSSSGGGALDVAAFALRCAFWSLKRTRPLIILDEPAKFLSRNLQSRAARMVKMISEKLGIQFLITSHIPELIETADRVFEVTIRDGRSKVERLSEEKSSAPSETGYNKGRESEGGIVIRRRRK